MEPTTPGSLPKMAATTEGVQRKGESGLPRQKRQGPGRVMRLNSNSTATIEGGSVTVMMGMERA